MSSNTKRDRASNTLEHLRLSQSWPAPLRDRLDRWASERGITLSAAILSIVADRMEKDEVKS